MKDIMKRGLCLLMALLCVCSLSTNMVTPVQAVSQSQINALKKDAKELNSKKRDLESKLKTLKGDKAQVLEKRKLLDEKIEVTAKEIQNTEEQIAGYADLIAQSERELAEAEQKEAEQYDLFCKRVRAMEKQGKLTYWSVLFRATSFSDLLGRLDIINEIMRSDQRIMDRLKALQVEIEERKAGLETQKKESEAVKAQLVKKKSSLDRERKEAIDLVNQINANEKEYSSTLQALDREEENVQSQIVALSKKLAEEEAARQQAAGKPVTPTALGGYIWPVPSRKVTSPFGKRPSPGGIGSRNHKGVDIGGVGYNTPVKAAKAGTVIVSKYSSSYGNYVSVSHGSGNTTLYAHMSSRNVKVGDKVNQGDVLGITGSTGHSTGAHLHFEITENGQRVNPLNYLTGYQKHWK